MAIVIRGGSIIDGTGREPVAGDVLIDGERIVSVGSENSYERGVDVVEADGMAIYCRG